MPRPSGRAPEELRSISISRFYTKYAEGSVLISYGDTQVLCTASVEEKVPIFLRGGNQGWITAEYGMLPRATESRTVREAARGKQSGRTLEIQRLIGRSLRAVVDLRKLGERTVIIDCDVIQADGGTRTASITGGYVALVDAVLYLLTARLIKEDPLIGQVASVSSGIFDGQVVLDLDYAEDSVAETDMNFVMNQDGKYIEIQGTAEGSVFSMDQLVKMSEYAERGIEKLIQRQCQALKTK